MIYNKVVYKLEFWFITTILTIHVIGMLNNMVIAYFKNKRGDQKLFYLKWTIIIKRLVHSWLYKNTWNELFT